MRGVAARHPRFDAALGRFVNVEERINACVVNRQRAPRLPWESEALLSLTAFVARQSRGISPSVSIDGPARETWDAGRRLYFSRIGQLNLACTNCHDANWGKTLLAESVSQGHPTGWPAYRLEWQSMGSLERAAARLLLRRARGDARLRFSGLVALELYLAWRATGLAAAAPGVRR
jgi:sulfur-oxidizing protein SoxA